MRNLHKLSLILPVGFFILAAFLVHHELAAYSMSALRDSIAAIPTSVILLALGLTFLNYAIMALYDMLALGYIGHALSWPRVVLASFISYAVSINTGHALISGTSIRYRFYKAWGIGSWDILKLSLFVALTFVIGIFTLEVVTVLSLPPNFREVISAPPQAIYTITAICALFLVAYWAALFLVRKPVTIRNISFELPKPLLAFKQVAISSLDLVLAAFILYLFLHERVDIPFHSFLTIYVIALILGLASQVPGGIGVFESTFLWMAGNQFAPPDILAALILYRIVYYFVPLLVAGIGLISFESHLHRERLSRSSEHISRLLGYIIPPLFAVLLLIVGGMMLLSGAVPPFRDNMQWLDDTIPLLLVEMSHVLGSLIGVALLFLSRGILLRLDAAYYASTILLGVGICVSLLKGLDWREAGVLLTMLVLFLPTHRYFRRRASLWQINLPLGWIAMIILILAATAWVGFQSYAHVEYADDLWWQFDIENDAPRFLRALATTLAAFLIILLYHALRFARPQDHRPTAEDISDISRLVKTSHDTTGFLALLGDKKLLWNESRTAFIMYATTPRYWIAMADPVGDAAAFNELMWTFREKADRYGAKAVFYEVSDKYLPLYLDLGQVLLKIGEEARIALPGFTLEGGRREKQRKLRNKFVKGGYNLRFLEGDALEDALPTLKSISDDWLRHKKTQEKRFSLGFFDPDYLRHTRVAVIEKDGEIFAFANLWALESKSEITFDLMRYRADAPDSVMEFLFISLILWARDEGYQWCNLGMAPLSGLESHPLAPLWHKIGTLIFRHGEEFYNFEGLKAYKSKFDPHWTPHYIAVPPGLHIPLVLLSVAAVISGNIKGIFRK